MAVVPRVSIVLPLYNDEEFVAEALDSCLSQSLAEIEILAIDDASTDDTAAIVDRYARRDSRIRLIRQPTNLSAFQARRTGIDAAAAPYVLFLDGDDELAPDAARTALATAHAVGADVVGFGVDIVVADSDIPRRFEAALQPRHSQLTAPAIIPQLFPPGEEANGHIWRYLFATQLLRAAYAGISPNATYYRANDLPITFLALANATKYVSTPDRLYRYSFRRGTSGHAVESVENFRFLVSGIAPITAIEDEVRKVAARSSDPDSIIDSYQSARLHIIGNVLRYCIRDTSGDFQETCLAMLKEAVGDLTLSRAAATFVEESLPALAAHALEPSSPTTAVRSVLLTTAHLGTGGLQGVLLEQARHLVARGFKVTVAVMRASERDVDLPTGVELVEVSGSTRIDRLDRWLAICNENAVDVIIDHHILYNENWPWFALVALNSGIPTIGWVHNFALRPLFDGSLRSTFLTRNMRLLSRVVTLSPIDVAYWKLRGVDRVVYLPNPPSQLARAALARGGHRELTSGRIELAWWGRLDPDTKRVQDLVQVAEKLRAGGVDFRLRIIGPDSRDLTSEQVKQNAITRGVGDAVDLAGEHSGEELLAVLADSDLLVMTSAIEGSPLTITEAQAMGLPVVMYELPWITDGVGSDGIITTPSGDPAALADAISTVAHSPALYTELSRSARASAQTVAAIDYEGLLEALLSNTLPAEYSPEPTVEDARLLVDWMIRFSERNIRLSSRGFNTDAEVAALKRERDRAQRKVQQITEGPSFRVGRALTAIPRRLKHLARGGRGIGSIVPRFGKYEGPRVRGLTQRLNAAPPPPLRAPNNAVPRGRVTTPDVTFVIPIFNSAPWLADCLSSVLAQSDIDIEVICINDGSTDNSGAVLQALADSDPRVTIIDQPNQGQSVARNRGLEAALGRYVIFLDSDDYWPNDALAGLVRRADEDDLDLLLFDCTTFRDGEVDERTWRWYSTYYQRSHTYSRTTTGTELMVAMRRNRDYRPHVGLYLTRTSFVRQIGLEFIPGIVHQDNPYTFRLLLSAKRASHERLDAYARRIRPGSTITTLSADRSARGYFLSYLAMARDVNSLELDPPSADIVQDILDYVYEAARKQFAIITVQDADELRLLDSSADAQAVFRSLINQKTATESNS